MHLQISRAHRQPIQHSSNLKRSLVRSCFNLCQCSVMFHSVGKVKNINIRGMNIHAGPEIELEHCGSSKKSVTSSRNRFRALKVDETLWSKLVARELKMGRLAVNRNLLKMRVENPAGNNKFFVALYSVCQINMMILKFQTSNSL